MLYPVIKKWCDMYFISLLGNERTFWY